MVLPLPIRWGHKERVRDSIVFWSIGVMELWNDGLRLGENTGLEAEKDGFRLFLFLSTHYSIIPCEAKPHKR
jgi:hypothetical protein